MFFPKTISRIFLIETKPLQERSNIEASASAEVSVSQTNQDNSQQSFNRPATYLPPLLSSLSSRVDSNDEKEEQNEEEAIPLSATLPAEDIPVVTTSAPQLPEANKQEDTSEVSALSSYAFECHRLDETQVNRFLLIFCFCFSRFVNVKLIELECF